MRAGSGARLTKPFSPPPSDVLPPVRLHLLKAPVSPDSTAPVGTEGSNSSWRAFLIQNPTPTRKNDSSHKNVRSQAEVGTRQLFKGRRLA